MPPSNCGTASSRQRDKGIWDIEEKIEFCQWTIFKSLMDEVEAMARKSGRLQNGLDYSEEEILKIKGPTG
jgi:hypothetical protein